jgi:multidrug efflux pump subunit AcrA (membrane-fusion protein)
VTRGRWIALALVVAAGLLAAATVIRTRDRGAAPDQSAGETMPPPAPPGAPARGDVMLDLRRQQLIGVRTAPARRVSVSPEIRAVGIVRYDETRQAEINTRVDGWIRDLQADYTGKPIRRGEPLFTFYSPELVATQNEYVLALHGRSQSAGAIAPEVREYWDRLLRAARERLLRLDFPLEDIQTLEEGGRPTETITFRSPVAGVIVEKTAVQGMRVMAGQTLFRVADTSTVWVEADVYERELSLVRIGQSASVSLDAYPAEKIIGRVTYIYPTVDEKTRTGKVRFALANRDGRLKPGMYATVELAGAAIEVLAVPADALLDTGKEQLVFVAQGDGYFEPRPVTAGSRTGDEVEILEGLKEGEQVATGATFFLDSESQLRAAVQGYQPPVQPGAAPSSPREQLDITFRSVPDPPRTGENNLEVNVKDAAGQPIADADVTVTFFMAAMPTMNMPEMRNQAKLSPAGGGVYRGPGQIVMGGRWDVTVDVTRGGERLGRRQFALVAK